MLRLLISFALFIVLPSVVYSQCTTLGQTPATAFPVCGSADFRQGQVPFCENHSLPTECRTSDLNPYWYRFTCFEAGTLGFTIKPLGSDEDYDWQLFDVTNHNVSDVYFDGSLTIAANWAGTYGSTGAASGGVNYMQCGSQPTELKPTFAAMPVLIKGHDYLLMVSHFSATDEGYTLSFKGGTTSITDTLPPAILNAKPDCEGIKISLALNKQMKCATLEPNGSDFKINAPGVSIVGAAAVSCSSGFNMDTLVLTLNKALLTGEYEITLVNGDDDNTLLDNCDIGIAENTKVPLSILPKMPTLMDSLTSVTCAPQMLELVFTKPIKCSSIAADGSDFKITGPYQVNIVSAVAGACTNSASANIIIRLANPVVHQGTYTLTLINGIDGNTIIDECAQITPAGSFLNFTVNDTVSAVFDAKLLYGCKQDTISVVHDGRNNVNKWDWSFSNNLTRSTRTAEVIYTSYGEKKVTLAVTNGFCSDTTTQTINLDNELKARFISPEVACPSDLTNFTDTSIGNIISYQWNFGLGFSVYQRNAPAQVYPQAAVEKNYNVQLIVGNSLGCSDTAMHNLKVVYTCYIAVPSAFTPNGDGINDYLYPLNAYKADNLIFRVFNRYGQLVYATTAWTKKWDGKINGQPQANGTYVWMLIYTEHDTGKKVQQKGTTVLIK